MSKKNPHAGHTPVKEIQETIQDKDLIAPKPKRRYRALLAQGYVILATFGFIFLAIFAHLNHFFKFDLPITRFIQTLNPYWFDRSMHFLSDLGFSPLVIVMT